MTKLWALRRSSIVSWSWPDDWRRAGPAPTPRMNVSWPVVVRTNEHVFHTRLSTSARVGQG